MTAEVNAAAAPVIEEIGVQLDLLDVFGGRYARAYLAYHLIGAPRPHTPVGMHPMIARALRDLALDEAAAVRLYGPAKRRRAARTREREAAG